MKFLLMTFFTVLLLYSLCFNCKDDLSTIQVDKQEMKVVDKSTDLSSVRSYRVDTFFLNNGMLYKSSKKSAIQSTIN
ncbi:MAG: hypothetical protein M0P33_05875 [Massilibacteroides sp.]|nr:hypothetical protein [Massilibacteroides sp.]